MLIGSRKKVKAAQPFNLSMNNKCIKQHSCVRLLGVDVDDTLSWRLHCEYLLKKFSKCLGLLYRFKKYIPQKVLKSMAEALILSRLNYCCTVWGAVLNQNSIDYLQKFQNKVARLVLNYKVTEISRKDLYDEIGWLTVRQRIHFQTVMMLHKSLYTYEPSTIYMHLHVFEILHEHNTRLSLKYKNDKLVLKKPKYKKKTFLARAFRVRGVEIWNNLDFETRSITCRSRFRATIRKKLEWFI